MENSENISGMNIDIKNWEIERLQNLEANYVQKNATESKNLPSLAQIRVELLKRKCGEGLSISGEDIIENLKNLLENSPNGLTTYLKLWQKTKPGAPWNANNSINTVGKWLGLAMYTSITKNAPLYNIAVIRRNEEALTQDAKENIFNECVRLGYIKRDVNMDEFIDGEMLRIKSSL